MDPDDLRATLAPVHAPLEATARFIGDEVPEDREDEESSPLVVLSFDAAPEAAALFGSLLEVETESPISAHVEVWIPLEADSEPYAEIHGGHPVLRFLVTGGLANGSLLRALGFLVCAQCEPAFMTHITHCEEFGIASAVSDSADPSDPSMIPTILLVKADPVEIAYVELAAWRRAHGSWSR